MANPWAFFVVFLSSDAPLTIWHRRCEERAKEKLELIERDATNSKLFIGIIPLTIPNDVLY